MSIPQISLFLENRPGHLRSICRTLADASINILTLSLADTQQFGILRLIVQDHEQAVKVLRAAGYVVHLNDVVATEVEDRPGGMAEVLAALDGGDVNIEYMYAFTHRRHNRAVLVFRFAEPQRAVDLLSAKGIAVLAPVDLFADLT